MNLSQVYGEVKDAGVRLMTSTPWLQHSVEYAHSHPWISLGVAIGAVLIWKFITRPRDLPPGPFNIPLVGAIHHLGGDLTEKLLKLRQQYGDVIYMKVFGNELVFLISEDAIREAFKKHGDEFSNLNTSGFFGAIGPFPDVIFMAPYSTKLKANKKFAVTAIKNLGFGTVKSEQKIHQAIDKLEQLFLEHEHQPFTPQEDLKLYCTSVLFSIIFNEDLPLDDPKVIKLAKTADEWIKGLNEGIQLYDFILPDIPIVKTLFCRQSVKKTKEATLALKDDLKVMIQEHRVSFDLNETRDIIDYYFTHPDNMDDDDIAYNILSFLPDGIDTAGTSLSWLFYFITKHQDVQCKLQEQLEEIAGHTGQLSLADRPNLPYADAIVLESLRCANILPIAPPREIMKDLEFKGYRIPKGTKVAAALHSVLYDPDIFPEPTSFNPSRFIDDTGNMVPDVAKHVLAFSLGRRMCISEQYIKAQFFLILVRVAAKFNITFDPNQSDLTSSNSESFSAMNYPPKHKLCFSQR